MTTAWIKQSSGLYRATKRKGVAPSLQVDGATRKTNTRNCTRWCNQEEKGYDLKTEGHRVWCKGKGNELTYLPPLYVWTTKVIF
jgi:hypothetical protein